jgi:cell division protein FtsL
MAIPLRQPGATASQRRPVERRPLAVVPARRRVAWFAMFLTVLVSAVMIGAIGLHTRIAERQLELDALERSVHSAQEDFDVLRSERAELRSPTRVSAEAQAIGMVLGSESEFVAVDPMTLAVTIARTGHLPVDDEIVIGSDQSLAPLDQFRLVKAVSSEAP